MNNDLDRRLLLGAAGLAGVAAMAGRAGAGPLNPPGGPVASTGRTTDELWGKIARTDQGMAEARIPISAATTPGDANYQYILSQPGSYYLIGNLTGANARACIGIAASGVTIDLNGYALLGVPGAMAAIKLTGANGGEITIRNGHIRDWTTGIAVPLDQAVGVRMLDVTVTGCGRVYLGDGALVERCTVLNADSIGLQILGSGVVRASLFRACGSSGLVSGGGVVDDCAFLDNTAAGLSAQSRVVVRGCAAYSNAAGGYSAGAGSAFTDCMASLSPTGFSLAAACTIDRCFATNCSTAGISAGPNCLVTRCQAQQNTGTGIRVTSSDTRVESCNATDNAIGFEATGTGSIFIANTASGNTTNYGIDAANYGLFVAATAMAAVLSGSTGGTPLGTTDPRANLSY